ncbi:MAG: hypothetical protein AAF939_21085, partial [Planctomycetota bacterium]
MSGLVRYLVLGLMLISSTICVGQERNEASGKSTVSRIKETANQLWTNFLPLPPMAGETKVSTENVNALELNSSQPPKDDFTPPAPPKPDNQKLYPRTFFPAVKENNSTENSNPSVGNLNSNVSSLSSGDTLGPAPSFVPESDPKPANALVDELAKEMLQPEPGPNGAEELSTEFAGSESARAEMKRTESPQPEQNLAKPKSTKLSSQSSALSQPSAKAAQISGQSNSDQSLSIPPSPPAIQGQIETRSLPTLAPPNSLSPEPTSGGIVAPTLRDNGAFSQTYAPLQSLPRTDLMRSNPGSELLIVPTAQALSESATYPMSMTYPALGNGQAKLPRHPIYRTPRLANLKHGVASVIGGARSKLAAIGTTLFARHNRQQVHTSPMLLRLQLEALALSHSGGDDQPFVFDPGFTTPILRHSDLDPGSDISARYKLLWQNFEGTGLEISYFNLNDFSARTTFENGVPVNFGGIPAMVANSYDSSYDSKVQSLEFNGLVRKGNRFRVGLGFRAIEIDEDFNTVETGTQDGFFSSTRNQLFGGQLILEAIQPINRFTVLEVGTRYGIYANDIDVSFDSQNRNLDFNDDVTA